VEVDFGRVGEDLGVEVASRQHASDTVTLLQFGAAHLDVLRDHAARKGHGPATQQLLDDIVDVIGPRDDLFATLWVPGEPEPDVVERRKDGVEPADEQEDYEAKDLF